MLKRRQDLWVPNKRKLITNSFFVCWSSVSSMPRFYATVVECLSNPSICVQNPSATFANICSSLVTRGNFYTETIFHVIASSNTSKATLILRLFSINYVTLLRHNTIFQATTPNLAREYRHGSPPITAMFCALQRTPADTPIKTNKLAHAQRECPSALLRTMKNGSSCTQYGSIFRIFASQVHKGVLKVSCNDSGNKCIPGWRSHLSAGCFQRLGGKCEKRHSSQYQEPQWKKPVDSKRRFWDILLYRLLQLEENSGIWGIYVKITSRWNSRKTYEIRGNFIYCCLLGFFGISGENLKWNGASGGMFSEKRKR